MKFYFLSKVQRKYKNILIKFSVASIRKPNSWWHKLKVRVRSFITEYIDMVPDPDMTWSMCSCNSFYILALNSVLCCMCFLLKFQGILISPALHFPNLTLFWKGTFFNWNLNVRDLKPNTLKQLLSQDYVCIAHEQFLPWHRQC